MVEGLEARRNQFLPALHTHKLEITVAHQCAHDASPVLSLFNVISQ